MTKRVPGVRSLEACQAETKEHLERPIRAAESLLVVGTGLVDGLDLLREAGACGFIGLA